MKNKKKKRAYTKMTEAEYQLWRKLNRPQTFINKKKQRLKKATRKKGRMEEE